MSSGVNLDLINSFDPNLTWKTVKKGPRSETRCPRKPAGRNIKMGIGAELGSNISKIVQDSSDFESEKLGVAVLGEHFAENTTAVPIKKRILSGQSPSPPPRTPSLNREASLSPEPNTPSPIHEESDQLLPSKSVSRQCGYSNSSSKKRANKKKNRPGDGKMKSKKAKLTPREFSDAEDFSGIALLVAAACSSSIEDNADHIESSTVEELATPEGNDASRVVVKESVTTSESEGSSVPEIALPVVQSLHCDNVNDSQMKNSAPSVDTRLHWDLNTVMDEWEEPCFDPPPNNQETCAEGIVDGGLLFQNLKKEDCESRELDNVEREIGSIASDAEITSIKSDRVTLFAPASSTSAVVEVDDVTGDLNEQDVVQGSATDKITSDLRETVDSEAVTTNGHSKIVTEEADQGGFQCEKLSKLLDNDKLVSENPMNDNVSEILGGEQADPADRDNILRVQEGYDSPFEDGELREPVDHAWEENEVGSMENECVDFEFDNEYEDDLDAGEQSMLEKFAVTHQDRQSPAETRLLVEKNVDAVPCNDMVHVKDVTSKPNSFLSLKMPKGYQLQEIGDDGNVEGNDSKFYIESKSGNDETRTFSGSLLHMEGSSLDGLHRRDTAYMRRSRHDEVGDTYSRTERVFCSEKMMGRDRPPFQRRRWVEPAESGWDSRNHYGYTRSRNVISDSDGFTDGKPSGINNHDHHNSSKSYGPRDDMFRPLNRRQSPTERNEFHPLNRRAQPIGGFSRERSRGRSGFIPQSFRRGPPEEYHVQRGHYYLERKEIGFSPSHNGDSHISRVRRRSRSRSRSMSPTPIAWNMHDKGTRRHSPDLLRTEGRLQVERLPFRKPSISGDFEKELVPPPPRGRSCLSPQRNSRCFDDRRRQGDGEYKERRSPPPARMFRRNPRFNSDDCYPERAESGDYFRPMTRPPGRYHPQMPVGGRGGSRNFDVGSDDRRKAEGRYDTMNRVRRYDSGGGYVNRNRYDDDVNSFESHNAARKDDDSYRRATVRRAAPASDIREERSPPRIHQQEKLITADAPLPREQDFDANTSTKEV